MSGADTMAFPVGARVRIGAHWMLRGLIGTITTAPFAWGSDGAMWTRVVIDGREDEGEAHVALDTIEAI